MHSTVANALMPHWCSDWQHPMDIEVRPRMGSPEWQAQETQLLLSVLDYALNRIALASNCHDDERASRYLVQVVDSYGSVKGLLPKLGLTPEQTKLVEDRLEAVRRLLPLSTPASR